MKSIKWTIIFVISSFFLIVVERSLLGYILFNPNKEDYFFSPEYTRDSQIIKYIFIVSIVLWAALGVITIYRINKELKSNRMSLIPMIICSLIIVWTLFQIIAGSIGPNSIL